MMPSFDDRAQNIPMVTVGYEDIYNEKKDMVVAIRIWHFVFDKSHSTSDLARKLMNENADESDHSGAAHCPNNMRRTSVVTAAKASHHPYVGVFLPKDKGEGMPRRARTRPSRPG